MKKVYLFLLLISTAAVTQAQKNKVNLLVGTYTNSCNSRGIYVYEFDSNNAQIRLKKSSDSIASPSYLSLSNDEKFIYAVNEKGKQSTVSSLSFDAVSGKPSLINSVSSKGADPCYIINDDTNVIVANYSGGNISVFGKKEDGSLTEAKQVVQHYGKGVKAQQTHPHVHMVYFSPDKKYVLSNDLGTDKVHVYNYNPTAVTDVLTLKDSVSVKSGSGPRHLTFSNNGKYVYLLQELDGLLTTFSYADGKLTQLHETTILAKDYNGTFSSADIHVSPNGKFLYASNRGDANNITIFKISGKGKKVKLKGQVSTLGKGPRNFAIDPTGKFLLVAHQYTNDIVIFKINKRKGTLTDTKKRIDLCSPVCLVFAK